MLAATGDMVVFTDADLATPPDQIPLLTRALADHDIALGSRVQPDGRDRRASQPLHRRFLGRVFHALAAAWVTGPVPDTQCGFKGFRREVARDLFGRQQLTSIVFDTELIYLARKRRYTMAIVPVQWSDKRGSRMRIRPGVAARVAWDLVRIPMIHGAVRQAEPVESADAGAGRNRIDRRETERGELPSRE
jgi:dolichyl-phosphate beta-glucosyltransferase